MERWYLDALIQFTAKVGRPPKLHELGTWLERSRTAVHSALVSLEHKGWVRRRGGTDPVASRQFVAVEEDA
jgi:DNA-binding FadR family transcriptional regulator